MEKNSPTSEEEQQGTSTIPVSTDDATEASDAGIDMDLNNIVIALLFAADEPLSVRKMSAVIETTTADEIKKSVDKWRKRFDDEAWSIRIEIVGGGYQISSHPDYAAYIARLYSGKRKFRLSKAGLEVLAVIGYKQPVTRAEIENIRGVSSGGVMTTLMERSLIKIVGKAKVLGAPFLYGTTPDFLAYLGLASIKDLPSMEELEALLEKEAYPESGIEDETIAEVVVAAIEETDSEIDEPDEVPVREPIAASATIGNFSGATTPAEPETEYDADPPAREEEADEQATGAPTKSADDTN